MTNRQILDELRRRLRLHSDAALARHLGVRPQRVHDYAARESGSNMPHRLLEAFAALPSDPPSPGAR